MAIRVFEYSVGRNSITPANIVKGGVQGEHNATRLIFNLNTELNELLYSMKNDGIFSYRFDGIDGSGEKHSYFPQEFSVGEKQSFEFDLEHCLTVKGGIVQVFFIITLTKKDKTNIELVAFSVKVGLKSAKTNDDKEFESLSALALKVKEYAEETKKTQEETEALRAEVATMKEETQKASVAFHGNTEWVFGGGTATDVVAFDFIVDTEMSDDSNNAIANGVSKKYIDSLIDKMHPIGSLYFSCDETDPSEIFGGSWERVKDKFILAAGDKYKLGDTGGSEEHYHIVDPEKVFAKIYSTEILYMDWKRIEGATKSWTPNDFIKVEKDTGASDVDGGVGVYGNTDDAGNMPPYEVYYCWKRIA